MQQLVRRGSLVGGPSAAAAAASAPRQPPPLPAHARGTRCSTSSQDAQPQPPSRRELLLGGAAVLAASAALPAEAIQGVTAGRIPGLSTAPDATGFFVYQRPEGKSGGHGVGWSEIPRYSFSVPPGWQETPVSIADLGGTEIDLRFSGKEEGSLLVVVAPVLRFQDVGYNADVRIAQLGKPDTIISGFAPELFGKPLDDDEVVQSAVREKDGLTYYEWELKSHHLVAATAVRNRLFFLAVNANGRQFKKHRDTLQQIQQSFVVPVPSASV